MTAFLIAGLVFAAVAATAYYCFSVFFSANASAASREAKREGDAAKRSKKRRGAGA